MRNSTQRKADSGGETTVAGSGPDIRQAAATRQPAGGAARAVQDRLAEDLPLAFEDHRRWSPRATLALSGGVSLLLWAAIGLALSSLR